MISLVIFNNIILKDRKYNAIRKYLLFFIGWFLGNLSYKFYVSCCRYSAVKNYIDTRL